MSVKRVTQLLVVFTMVAILPAIGEELLFRGVLQRNLYEWSKKSCETRSGYTKEQFRIYDEISRENACIDYVQVDHYLDEGCMCKACGLKRVELASKVVRGLPIGERIVHTEAKSQLIQRRTTHVNKLNHALQHIQMMPRKIRGKDFNSEMTSIVKGKLI
jgi:hypothetical protein